MYNAISARCQLRPQSKPSSREIRFSLFKLYIEVDFNKEHSHWLLDRATGWQIDISIRQPPYPLLLPCGPHEHTEQYVHLDPARVSPILSVGHVKPVTINKGQFAKSLVHVSQWRCRGWFCINSGNLVSSMAEQAERRAGKRHGKF